jgi:hypothetical protein
MYVKECFREGEKQRAHLKSEISVTPRGVNAGIIVLKARWKKGSFISFVINFFEAERDLHWKKQQSSTVWRCMCAVYVCMYVCNRERNKHILIKSSVNTKQIVQGIELVLRDILFRARELSIAVLSWEQRNGQRARTQQWGKRDHRRRRGRNMYNSSRGRRDSSSKSNRIRGEMMGNPVRRSWRRLERATNRRRKHINDARLGTNLLWGSELIFFFCWRSYYNCSNRTERFKIRRLTIAKIRRLAHVCVFWRWGHLLTRNGQLRPFRNWKYKRTRCRCEWVLDQRSQAEKRWKLFLLLLFLFRERLKPRMGRLP